MKIGSLFSGYGGLDLAVEAIFNAQPAWFCEYDEAPSKVLAHHWPDVPNLRDVTQINWAQVEPVDILVGGSPCQDLSHAGKRTGMTEGTRSNLWVNMREAIATLQPKLVVWENVLGALSATATSDSDMEQGGGTTGSSPRRTSSGTRSRTRRPYRNRVRHGMDNSTSVRHRRTPPPRKSLPHRLAKCSQHQQRPTTNVTTRQQTADENHQR